MDTIILKLIVIGDSGVGKTSIADYYVNNNLINVHNGNTPTIGIELFSKNIVHQHKFYNLHIWDTAGQERFKAIAKSYYRDAYGALICFSIEKRYTFDNIRDYLYDLLELSHNHVQIVLVGTFSDIEYRQVSKKEITDLANKLGLEYYEVSAKTGKNIKKCFNELIDKVHLSINLGHYEYKTVNDKKIMIKNNIDNSLSCC